MNESADNHRVLLLNAVAPANAICLAQGDIVDKQSILANLQRHFHFPDYFGENFDAAYDLLLDIVDTLKAATVWRFRIGSQPNIDKEAFACWQQLMQDLMQYAGEKGVELQIELFLEP